MGFDGDLLGIHEIHEDIGNSQGQFFCHYRWSMAQNVMGEMTGRSEGRRWHWPRTHVHPASI